MQLADAMGMSMNTTQTTTLRGIIVPEGWDDQGKVLKLAIATYDEGRVLITPNVQGMKLLSWLRKTVKLEGILTLEGALREINVHGFVVDHPPRQSRLGK